MIIEFFDSVAGDIRVATEHEVDDEHHGGLADGTSFAPNRAEDGVQAHVELDWLAWLVANLECVAADFS